MKGWMVISDAAECHILCRAETRGRARKFWPDDADFTSLRVVRAAWLDGGDREMEIMGQWTRCDGPYDEDGYCIADHHCWEGEYLDQAKTLAAIKEAA